MGSFNDTMKQEIAARADHDMLKRLSTLETKVDELCELLKASLSKPVKVVGSKKDKAA